VLCVLGLLAGLLGMHGLAPGGGVPQQTHAQQTHAPQTHARQTPAPQIHSRQTHALQTHSQVMPYGHCGDGSVQHADATCASGAVSGGPVLPPLVPDPVPVAVGEGGAVRAFAVVEPDSARAPPSLAELQLLRI
jgi:hypothetical protein